MSMTNNSGTKTRINGFIPTIIYKRLCSDSIKYGINKTDILCTALTEYYIRRDNLTLSKSGIAENASDITLNA